LEICGFNPDPGDASVLQVLEPEPEAEVERLFTVRGWGSQIGLEDIGVVTALVNADQEVVVELNVPPQPRTHRVPPPDLDITEFARPFEADIFLGDIVEETPLCLWVFSETDAEGQPMGVVQVPIVVRP
jgi:hypothetical protein